MGAAASADSYLRMDKIIQVAKDSGAKVEAWHGIACYQYPISTYIYRFFKLMSRGQGERGLICYWKLKY